MFDGREAVDRLDNRGQAAVYWGQHAAAAETWRNISVRIPYTTSIIRYIWRRLTDLDLYIMDVWETLHIKLNGINNTSVARGSTKDVQSIIAAHIFHLNYS